VSATATSATAGKPAEKPKIDTGMLAAIGIAASALIGGISSVAAAVFGLPLWKIPFVFVGVILAISGPAMIIAFLKLRQRTLGPLLEANGWAINGRVKINLPLGNSLTAAKRLPSGAKRLLEDPFEDKDAKRRFRLTIATFVLIALIVGHNWFGYGFQIRFL
jgi:type IV secretory pathway TrbD component